MTLHPLFVAGVLEGFEGTLGEMVVSRTRNCTRNSMSYAARWRRFAFASRNRSDW